METSVIDSLIEAVGEHNVLTDPFDLDRYTGDALSPSRAYGAESAFEQLAEVVVRPRTTAEVSAVVSFANRRHIPVVPYGAGTGVMGGTVPVRGGIVLDMQRMDGVLSVDPVSLTAEVEAGAVLGTVEEILSEYGLMLGHDPYSVPIATIAGTISTNGVGYRASAHGPMGDQVVALEAVLPGGQTLSTRAVPMYSSGPNLNHLFIGAEGSFGVITKATIKVFRLPEAQVFAAVAFDSFDHGFNAAAEMVALGIRPALLDLTEEEDGILFHLLFEGFSEGVTAQEKRTMQVCIAHGGRPAGPAPTMAYWEVRRDSAVNYRSSALGKPRSVRWSRWSSRRGFDYLHLALPTSRVLEYRREADRIMAAAGIKVVAYAIWSRPELFSMLIVPEFGGPKDSRERLARTVDEILRLAQDMGGVMEYCHGVGVKLNHLLSREMGVGHAVLRDLKKAIDPNNIMNPGRLGLEA